MIKFATVGAGWIVDSFLKGAKENAPDFVHSAVYSFSEAEGKAFGAKHGITDLYFDLDDLGNSDIDAVYIANPNAFHYSTAMNFYLSFLICKFPHQSQAIHLLNQISSQHQIKIEQKMASEH